MWPTFYQIYTVKYSDYTWKNYYINNNKQQLSEVIDHVSNILINKIDPVTEFTKLTLK